MKMGKGKESLIRLEYEKKIANLKNKHTNAKIDLIDKLNGKAIDAALTTNNERLDASNHKYVLLKEQAAEFPTKADLKAISDKVDLLAKLVYIGLGGLIVVEFVLNYFKR